MASPGGQQRRTMADLRELHVSQERHDLGSTVVRNLGPVMVTNQHQKLVTEKAANPLNLLFTYLANDISVLLLCSLFAFTPGETRQYSDQPRDLTIPTRRASASSTHRDRLARAALPARPKVREILPNPKARRLHITNLPYSIRWH